MTVVGKLGQGRVAIALLWFIPEEPPGEEAPTPEPSASDPAAEAIRNLTGLDATALMSRLQAIAAEYERDPVTMRREILRMTGGDEIATEHIIRLIQFESAENDNGDEDEPQDKDAEVIELRPTPAPSEDEDNGEDGGDQ